MSKSLSRSLSLVQGAPRWRQHDEFARRAYLIVQCFYVLFLYVITDLVIYAQNFAKDPAGFQPLWPVAWIQLVGIDVAVKILIPLSILAGIAGVTGWHRFTVRLAVCFVILQGVALWNSRASINHPYHEIFWISFCFLFLPNSKFNEIMSSRPARMQLLSAVSGAMALILLFYTMSGVYKCLDAAIMLIAGEKGGFSPYAMADTIAWVRIETNKTPIFSDFIINNPIIGWPMFLILYYAELVAIIVFFRPVLHRLWGFGLIMFHFGTIVFLEIPFNLHIVINALLFLMSPYAPAKTDLRAAAASLPIFGIVFRHGLGWKPCISEPQPRASKKHERQIAAET